MQKLLLFPFNGNAMESLDACENQFEVVGFIDDDTEKIGSEYLGIPIIGREHKWTSDSNIKLLAVPGSVNSFTKKKEIISALHIADQRWATVIHPNASVSKSAKIGINTLIMSGNVITSNAQIGDHCCILPNGVVHHDSIIADYNTLAAGVLIAGGVSVGDHCYLGLGCKIKNGVSIGRNTLVGMGANVLTDVGVGKTVFGNPAKERK